MKMGRGSATDKKMKIVTGTSSKSASSIPLLVDITRSTVIRTVEERCRETLPVDKRAADVGGRDQDRGMENETEPSAYAATLRELRDHVHHARLRVQRKANNELLQLWWQIGHTIRVHQVEQGWGAKV